MCRFYGWTAHYVENMEASLAEEYWKAITPIEATEYMAQMKMADFPHLKKEERRKTWKEISKKARLKDDEQSYTPWEKVEEIVKSKGMG